MEERLQKYMARCGIASRRKCEEIIALGQVKVNNVIVKELGFKIDSNIDIVEYQGKVIKPEERKVYIILNKPEGYVSTVKDEKNRKTILDLVNVDERIYPIGRLDYDTSGLILLTNDGEVYNKVIHPREEINKTYIALIKGIPNSKEIGDFENGVDIGGYITANASFKILRKLGENCKAQITIHEGKNRQIRRMCDAINHPVITLKRVSVGKINLENLKIGTWRYLTSEEEKYIKAL